MPDYKDFRLPDVGEGLTEAEILAWTVAPGDTVVVNQIIVEVETAKAAVELPSPFAGTVSALHAAVGDTIEVGRPIITIDVDPHGPPAAATPSDDGAPAEAEPKRQSVLVGYGVSDARPSRRRQRRQPEVSVPGPTAHPAFERPSAVRAILAKPPVRKLAKDLGVDLDEVTPTGPNGIVSRADVEAARSSANASPSVRPPAPTGAREERVPVRGVRKQTAAAMVTSAFTAPHVTEFTTVDVTEMMQLRDRIAQRREFRDLKVSPLLFVARAVLWAAGRTPIINSSWDEAAQEIVIKHYVNLGVAAATDRGLVVPNIKDAQALSLVELAQALAGLTRVARAGRTSPAEMSGGTFTITNLGVFGIDTGTPIINPGEAAILAVGAIRRQPWVVEQDGVETLQPRSVLSLSLSFDHRSIDGQQGSEFLADVAGVLHDPGLAQL